MRHLLIILILLSFTACDDTKEEQRQKEAEIAKNIRAEMLVKFEAEQKAQKVIFEKKLLEMKELNKIKTVTPPVVVTHKVKIPKPVVSKVETPKVETPKAHSPKVETPKEDSKLTQMGIAITENSISIDINKTKTYIKEVSHNLDKKIQEIGEDFSKGIIQTKEAGIDINEKHIHIDLNKTQNLIEDWGNRVKSFVNQFDEMAKTIDTNYTK
ncbi:MAG: hypothetical protein QM493_09135 [Sulfurovum sp.]